MKPDEYLDAILSLPEIYDNIPKVSPDGKWVAWSWSHVGPAADVFAVPTDGSEPPRRLTQTSHLTRLLAWAEDSQSLLISQDINGDERFQFFRVDLDRPLQMEPLTEPEPDYYIQGGQLCASGNFLVYAANMDFQQGKDLEQTWIYRHDLATGERKPIAQPLQPVRTIPVLNHAGTHILYLRKDLHPAGFQTWLVDREGTDDKEILNNGPDRKTIGDWLPDSRRVLAQVETSTHRKVGVWSLESGRMRWLLDDPSRDIRNAYVPFGSDRAVIVQDQQGRVRCSLLDVENGAEYWVPDCPGNLIPLAPLPDSGADIQGTGDRSRRQEYWIGLYNSSCQPDDIVSFALNDLSPERFASLTRVWEQTPLSKADFAPAEDFRWRSVDHLEIHGWLYRSRGQAMGTIVYVHGGPTFHSQDWINPQIQFFCACGFNVLDVNYRGSTGYGLPFREAIREGGWGSLEQEDIRTGIEALIAAGIATVGKIGITGTSYGGYSAWWAITHYPTELVAAAAPISGMTDLVVDYETTRPDIRPYSEEMMGGSPEQVPERYFERSPINFVDRIQGKLLIVQGEQDPNVTHQNVTDVTSRLDSANIPYELLTFETEGHGILKTPNQRILLQRLVDFFERAFKED